MHIWINKLISNSSNKFFFFIYTCPETTFQPAAPEPGYLSKIFLNIRKIYPKCKLFSQITYPLTPNTKPMHPVYAKVSDPTPPLFKNNKYEKTILLPSSTVFWRACSALSLSPSSCSMATDWRSGVDSSLGKLSTRI